MQPNLWKVILFYRPILVSWVLAAVSFILTRKHCLASNDPVDNWRRARRQLLLLFLPFLSLVTAMLMRIGCEVFVATM